MIELVCLIMLLKFIRDLRKINKECKKPLK